MKKIMSKKLKMAITLSVCAILLVFGTIMGTVAYLTSQTAPVKNTFTYGNVTITMDEAKADGTEGRTASNTYKLIPGAEYNKDLQIHVGENSEDCYLFVKIAKEFASIDPTIVTQLAAKGWEVLDAEKGIYYYDTTVQGGANVEVIKNFTVDTAATEATLDDFTAAEGYQVIGYAVQAAGFDNATLAWNTAKGAFGN